MRKFAQAILFALVLISGSNVTLAATVDATFSFMDITSRSNQVTSLTISGLCPIADNGSSQVFGSPRTFSKTAYPGITNGSFTISNIVPGFGVQVVFADGWTTYSNQYAFPSGLTGAVSAITYKSVNNNRTNGGCPYLASYFTPTLNLALSNAIVAIAQANSSGGGSVSNAVGTNTVDVTMTGGIVRVGTNYGTHAEIFSASNAVANQVTAASVRTALPGLVTNNNAAAVTLTNLVTGSITATAPGILNISFGSGTINGNTATFGSVSGDGSALTSLSAANISGTLANNTTGNAATATTAANLSGTITSSQVSDMATTIFNGTNKLASTNWTGANFLLQSAQKDTNGFVTLPDVQAAVTTNTIVRQGGIATNLTQFITGGALTVTNRITTDGTNTTFATGSTNGWVTNFTYNLQTSKLTLGAVDASAATNLNASSLASGTVPLAALGNAVTFSTTLTTNFLYPPATTPTVTNYTINYNTNTYYFSASGIAAYTNNGPFIWNTTIKAWTNGIKVVVYVDSDASSETGPAPAASLDFATADYSLATSMTNALWSVENGNAPAPFGTFATNSIVTNIVTNIGSITTNKSTDTTNMNVQFLRLSSPFGYIAEFNDVKYVLPSWYSQSISNSFVVKGTNLMAYVSTNGNNSTAVLGNPSRPFQTFDSAYTSVSNYGCIWFLGIGQSNHLEGVNLTKPITVVLNDNSLTATYNGGYVLNLYTNLVWYGGELNDAMVSMHTNTASFYYTKIGNPVSGQNIDCFVYAGAVSINHCFLYSASDCFNNYSPNVTLDAYIYDSMIVANGAFYGSGGYARCVVNTVDSGAAGKIIIKDSTLIAVGGSIDNICLQVTNTTAYLDNVNFILSSANMVSGVPAHIKAGTGAAVYLYNMPLLPVLTNQISGGLISNLTSVFPRQYFGNFNGNGGGLTNLNVTNLTGVTLPVLNGGNLTNLQTILVQTNFGSGQLYTNNYGSGIVVMAKVANTVAAVTGASDISLRAIASPANGGWTNSIAFGTTVAVTIAMTYTNVLSIFVPTNAVYCFTNLSTGAGNTANVVGGQIKYP